MSAPERLNNAIAAITRYTPASPQNVRRAVDDLGNAWARFWASNDRKYLPDAVLSAPYERFVQWYARAYLLVPQTVKDKCTDPRHIDASWATLAGETLARAWDEYSRVAKAAAKTGMNSAGAVLDGVTSVASQLSKDIERAGKGAAAPITAYGNAVRGTVIVVTLAWLVFKFAPDRKGA